MHNKWTTTFYVIDRLHTWYNTYGLSKYTFLGAQTEHDPMESGKIYETFFGHALLSNPMKNNKYSLATLFECSAD